MDELITTNDIDIMKFAFYNIIKILTNSLSQINTFGYLILVSILIKML